MRLKTTKRLLNLTSMAILASAGAVGYWGLTPNSEWALAVDEPKSVETPTSKSTKQRPAIQTTATITVWQADGTSLSTNWVRPLRRPLFDPPPVVAVVVKPPPQPLRVKLLATMVEPENSTAMLKHPGGQVVYRKIGESLGGDESGTQIEKIEIGSISVRRGQDVLRLSVEGASGK